MESDRPAASEAFKALGDPVRWTIVRYLAERPELPGSVLDEELSISRPTISYHIRILTQAGLVDVSKRGRNHYYTLRNDMVRGLLEELRTLMPELELVHNDTTPPGVLTAAETGSKGGPELRAVLPTW